MLTKPLDSDSENFADYLFDLLTICASWQWEKNYYGGMWITAERVASILNRLCILTAEQCRILKHNKELQRKFAANISRPNLTHGRYKWDGINTTYDQRRMILNAPTKWVITLDLRCNVNYQRLLENYKLHLTEKGNAYACRIAHRYEAIIDSDAYLNKLRRIGNKIEALTPATDIKDLPLGETDDGPLEEEPEEKKDDDDAANEEDAEPSAHELAEAQKELDQIEKSEKFLRRKRELRKKGIV